MEIAVFGLSDKPIPGSTFQGSVDNDGWLTDTALEPSIFRTFTILSISSELKGFRTSSGNAGWNSRTESNANNSELGNVGLVNELANKHNELTIEISSMPDI